ncbi:MAG: GxxExxY protein [Verrucomicrobia bacterium]|jgi:GxxExxY protein|nr:GxxExxY protein [Verrucomicrobiota bacterium]MBT7069128.1 GxxExxY protein [Verrucomicrobiota bacterium]MBT7699454.1 GxxExxY protein [Verrucomicrobiota bacterium]
MGKLLFEKESFAIRGAVFEVYKEMGCGFLESVYQECLERELKKCDIPFEPQKQLSLYYKGDVLDQVYIPDLVCYGQIILELKAAKTVSPEHRAQIINYLKASKTRVGFLVNFGVYPKATIERFVL